MKRILGLILAGIMLLSTVAYAEEFTLRNGIKFGDTMEEVLAKETFAISSVVDDDSKGTTGDERCPYSFETEHETLAGIPGSSITYYFDANKTLKDVTYNFRSKEDYPLKAVVEVEVENIFNELERKYGSPAQHTETTETNIVGNAAEMMIKSKMIAPLMGWKFELIDLKVWEIPFGAGHISIKHMSFATGPANKLQYLHKIGYTYITDEELANEQDAKASVIDDL